MRLRCGLPLLGTGVVGVADAGVGQSPAASQLPLECSTCSAWASSAGGCRRVAGPRGETAGIAGVEPRPSDRGGPRLWPPTRVGLTSVPEVADGARRRPGGRV